ncbi:hypothetical protein KZZ52_41580 [Dactylosporangium sp. AC04546]|uniref:hypothetical protein n=1 Tax=Dactylosporangium sp. AC04546 TaxID=2862460 RepID=UPI001EDD137F|nr:hypothetical protein [Dactylosporangium sp. AC04546]WVK80418.1 hypothetical protein KZZ52_41580 [Dactylosporangium sp. AC04546]
MIDFLGTPLVVDILRAIREGGRPRQSPEFCRYGDAVEAAIDALTAAGAVCDRCGVEPTLTLTDKGHLLCSLMDQVVDFDLDEAC